MQTEGGFSFQIWTPGSLAVKPHKSCPGKMPVVSHHCSWGRRGTRKQWDQALPTSRHHMQVDVLRKQGVSFLSFLKCRLSPMPTYQLGPSLCSSDKPNGRSLPQHVGRKRAQVLSCRGFRSIFPFIPAEQPAYTVRWLFSTGRRVLCSACAILKCQVNWAWEKKEPKKVSVK